MTTLITFVILFILSLIGYFIIQGSAETFKNKLHSTGDLMGKDLSEIKSLIGNPTNVIRNGNAFIHTYVKGGYSVTLTDDKVIDVIEVNRTFWS